MNNFSAEGGQEESPMEEGEEKRSFWAFPETAKDCGGLALWITVVLEAASLALVRSADPLFLWCLKVAFPICSGCLAALLYSRQEHRSFKECISAAMRSVASLYISLAVLAVLFLPMLAMYIFNVVYLNGIVASIVAAPFAIILVYLGGWMGYRLQLARWRYIR